MKKRILAAVLALVTVFAAIPALSLAVSADGAPVKLTPQWVAGSTVSGALTNLDDGSASTRVDFNDWSTASNKSAARYWKLEEGVLTVVGSGALNSDSSTAYAGFPWYTRGAEIETVILIGFTTIGTGAFYAPQNSTAYKNITKFVIGEGTTTLNDSAFGFYDSTNGTLSKTVDIYLPSSLTTVNSRAFRYGTGAMTDAKIGTVYASPALNTANLTVSATNNPSKITSKNYTPENYTHLFSTAYAWENSNGATELKIALKDASDNIPVSASDLDNYTWKVSIATHDFGKTIECTPSSVDASGVYRFRTCLGEGENQFIPRYHIVSKAKTATDYSVQVDICNKTTGEVVYRSEYKSGFSFPTTIEPIYPDDHQGICYLNGLVYIEGDLGGQYVLDRMEVYCYRGSTRYYKFAIVASNDNTLPASAWTWVGTQAADIGSTNTGYTVNITDAMGYRYIRIYPIGQYGAGGNSGYHFTDVYVYGTAYEAPPAPPANISLGKTVNGAGVNPQVVTDGSLVGYWDGGVCPASVVIDLAGYYDLSTINVVPYYSDGRYYHYDIEISTDNRTWTQAASKNDDTPATDAGVDHEVTGTARYVKVTVTYDSKNPSAHLVEVTVYGVENTTFVPEPIDYGENIALYKPVFGYESNLACVTDGSKSVASFWDGGLYPSYVVVDLQGYYDLSCVNVVTYYGDGRYYRYSIQLSTDNVNWTTAVTKSDGEVATGDGIYHELSGTARYVKVMITYNSKNSSAHLVEISVYGTENTTFVPSEVPGTDAADPLNIAYHKPTRANSSTSVSNQVVDGDTSTAWRANYFPAYVDIDLLDNYELSEMVLFMPTEYTYSYTVYGSLDGLNFTRLYKTGLVQATSAGAVIPLTGIYRVLRVNVTACGGGTYKPARINEVRVHGTASGSTVTPTRETMEFTSYEEWLLAYAGVDLSTIADANGKYDVDDTYTEADTVAELNGIVTRQLGAEYISWFTFDVAPNPNGNGKDYFKLEDENGKVKISGADGVCIASGLNWYLKYWCGVQIVQETKQVDMPESIPAVGTPVFKETEVGVRYAYNYCTLSYTMAFFGYEDWRRELDWLYLNGINVILDITGTEALWVSYLQKLGYGADDAKLYVCGYGYKAWWLMGNLENFNGTVSDLYVLDALEMARRNQRSMTVMGAEPALQAFVGAVPDNFGTIANQALTALGYPNVVPSLVAQGKWQVYTRPNVLRTDYEGYSYLAQLFYDTQNEMFGQITDYYCGDVCHEGGKVPADLTKAQMSGVIINELIESDANAVWILQRWQSNPTADILAGLAAHKNTNVAVIDLSTAYTGSYWKNTTSYGGKEFAGTNWIFSSVDNFGGRPLMHGDLSAVVTNILDAKNNANYMIGMGMTPEGTQNNPIYYDLYWEMVWRDTAPDLDEWIADYADRRYNGASESQQNAWALLYDTVYAYPNTNCTSGNYSVINRCPEFNTNFGTSYFVPRYDNGQLLQAITYMLYDFDLYADNKGYIYDLVEMMQTYLSNVAQGYIVEMTTMAASPTNYDIADFDALCEKYLDLLLQIDEMSAFSENQLLGRWIDRVYDWMENANTGTYDDYTEDSMVQNAKMLISCWTSDGVLNDYAHRLYNGYLADYNYPAWSQFFAAARVKFAAGTSYTGKMSTADYLHKGLEFVLGENDYATEVSDPRGDGEKRGILALYDEIIEEHAPEGYDGYRPGDVNKDSHVNIADVTVILNCLRGVEISDRADLTGDGILSITDVTVLLDILG